jgi:hypothetical protein
MTVIAGGLRRVDASFAVERRSAGSKHRLLHATCRTWNCGTEPLKDVSPSKFSNLSFIPTGNAGMTSLKFNSVIS